MKKTPLLLLLLPLFAALLLACEPPSPQKASEEKTEQKDKKPQVPEQLRKDSAYHAQHFTKKEYRIPMRDGKTLFTAVYTPKDTSQDYPVLMKRTCYSCRPYGEDNYPYRLGPSRHLMKDGYIFVYQDVRGRYMSEGEFVNMRPHIPNKKDNTQVDEASDTYDTIEWMLKNLDHFNGRVGQYGISYPGFYTTASALCDHPAMVASSPQGCMSDIWYDDWHHQGAFVMSSLGFTHVFGYQKDSLVKEPWYGESFLSGVPDGYDFYMDMGPAKNADKHLGDNFLWQSIKKHPNYDEFWQKRRILRHTKVDHAVMTVGGWFDNQDLYGSFETYKSFEEKSPQADNICVYGPWRHGGWARDFGPLSYGDVYFGDSISNRYQKEIEFEFFKHYLKGDSSQPVDLPEATVIETGRTRWHQFDAWPPRSAQKTRLYLHEGGTLSQKAPQATESLTQYTSDPANPVPVKDGVFKGNPMVYMVADQRFADRRPDVVTFQTDTLKEDFSICGEITANLQVATTGTDADWFVKLIDVYPNDHKPYPHQPDKEMGGYQQMVRSEVFRSRFRNSMEKPEPLKPNQQTTIRFPLQDVCHTFKPGHRIMIQIQSTAFPLIERNPQRFVDNIRLANEEDYQTAEMKVFHQQDAATYLEVDQVNF